MDIERHLHISEHYKDELLSISESLFRYTKISYFGYNRYFKGQKWIGLYSDTTPIRKDLNQSLSPLFLDENGIFIQEGSYFQQDMPEILKKKVDKEFIQYFFQLDQNDPRYKVAHNAILIIRKSDYYDESFYFSFQSSHSEIDYKSYYFSIHPILKNHCYYFLHKASKIIKKAEKYKESYRPFANRSISEIGMEKVNEALNPTKYSFQTENGDVFLSSRELSCLECLVLGMTIKQIANHLNLGHRTIETHINNIKNKLFCEERTDLVHKYNQAMIKI